MSNFTLQEALSGLFAIAILAVVAALLLTDRTIPDGL